MRLPVVLIALSSVLAACSSDVATDYSQSTNYSAFKTYQLLPASLIPQPRWMRVESNRPLPVSYTRKD